MKSSFIILLLISLIILSGASGCSTTTDTKVSNIGLKISFGSNAPPASVVTNKEFPIYVDMQNMGGEYINAGQAKFYLSGGGQSLENAKTTLTNEKTFTKESAFPDRISFAENAKFNYQLQDSFVSTLVLTTCYDYGGVSQATICVAGNNESKICSLDGEKIVTNTAGPIQISGMTETIVGDRLQLSFDILNKAPSGQVYLPNTECDKLQLKDVMEGIKQGKVNIEIRSTDNFLCRVQSEAQPYGQIMSTKGDIPLGKMLCEKKITDEDYKSPFAIILRYKYRDSISTNINILPESI